ncbi:uncharacterized protein [Typha angustifolia]|uniref:uncharacterized protein n=1 Tax=Typha angustifolia TaxID=59011 RepID=UPI003C2F1A11
MSVVYASNNLREQRNLWDELLQLAAIDVPWVVAGNFNAYRSTNEKKSCGTIELGSKRKAFADFTEAAGLCNLGFEGLPYTWCNNQEDGRWVQSKEVERTFQAFYNKLWGPVSNNETQHTRWPPLQMISTEEAEKLISTVSVEEIKKALWSLPRGKAPGPHGLQAEVYIKFWDAMSSGLCEAISHFFNHASMPHHQGRTLVTLISKKDRPTMWIKPEEKEAICNSLGLRPACMPFNYLGVQILGQRIKVREHNRLVDRVAKKLAGWKRGVLSMADKLMLINATMLAIPTYWMGSTWLSDSVLESITKKARAFLWDNSGGCGMHLIDWDTATCPKEEGGLSHKKAYVGTYGARREVALPSAESGR